jgi:glyoxylase-like metal-dependent hydrolase (beta-lactamase superfamily II)
MLIESPSPQPGGFAFDIKEVRQLADSIPGLLPREVRFEHVMNFNAPAAVVMTGDGWSQKTLWGIAYQLIYSDRTVIIDTAMSAGQAKELGTISAHYAPAYDRLIKAMSDASIIVLTHEHPDHIGGLAVHRELARLLESSAKVTSEQASNPQQMLPAKLSLGNYQPLSYDHYKALAPGIVLIKAPGHSLGSQMIYVKTASGIEILFIGDVAWSMRNVETTRGRPRLIGVMIHEDRQSVIDQLARIHALTEAEPKLVIVPGHDGGAIADLVKRGVIKEGFE